MVDSVLIIYTPLGGVKSSSEAYGIALSNKTYKVKHVLISEKGGVLAKLTFLLKNFLSIGWDIFSHRKGVIILNHFESFPYYFIARLVSARKVLFVFHTDLHGYLENINSKKRILIRSLLYFVREQDATFVSKSALLRYAKSESRSGYIYNPVVCNYSKHYSPVFINNKNNNIKIFVYIGRLHQGKGVGVILKVIKKLKSSEEQCFLYVYGSGPELGELKDYSKKLGVESQVFFMGYSENPFIEDEFPVSPDALLLCSGFEGFPSVLVEALFHGIYVISSNCNTGPSEIISGSVGASDFSYNSNGALFPVPDLSMQYDEDYFGEGEEHLYYILKNFDFRQLSSSSCKKRRMDYVSEKFSQDAFIRMIDNKI